MPIHQLKYQTGETVIANGTGEGLNFKGENAMVISTWKELKKYTNLLSCRSEYDNSSPEKTYYATYSLDRENTWWYYETDIEPYCPNVERGLRELKTLLTDEFLRRNYGMNESFAEMFRQEIFNPFKA